MNKEIDEIARTMCRHFGTNVCGSCDAHNTCMIHLFSDDIHRAGYRKQKVGRWIKPSPFSDPVCSECKKSPKRVFGMLAPFCPECGAEMEGGEG